MIPIKNKKALKIIESAGKILAQIFEDLKERVVAGVSTLDIDSWIADELNQKGFISQSMGYAGYKHDSCISVNDEVIHGVPSNKKFLKDGDIVKIDICASLKGYCVDSARCFFVGKVSERTRKIADAAMRALDAGIEKAVVGGRLSDISSAIQKKAESKGFGVLRGYCGHGIGKKMHEEPEIPNYGTPGGGPVLKSGMVFALEPMITEGDYQVKVAKDGWTVSTLDGGLSAHVEDTVIIDEAGPRAVTRL